MDAVRGGAGRCIQQCDFQLQPDQQGLFPTHDRAAGDGADRRASTSASASRSWPPDDLVRTATTSCPAGRSLGRAARCSYCSPCWRALRRRRCGWAAAIVVKYRDFRFVVPFALQFGLYVSPVGFPSSVVPEQWRLLYNLNPMVGIIDGFRWCIVAVGESLIYLPGFLGLSLGVIGVLFSSGLWCWVSAHSARHRARLCGYDLTWTTRSSARRASARSIIIAASGRAG